MTKYVFAVRYLVGLWRPNNLHKNPAEPLCSTEGCLRFCLFLEFKAALFRVYNYVSVLYADAVQGLDLKRVCLYKLHLHN